ncbi:MAG: outer membrane beta-barrel protein [Chryseolinea sp.]
MILRLLSAWLLLVTGPAVWAQQFSFSLGVNTGITASHTMDKGIDRDPRYRQYYNVKFAPVGLNLGVNYEFIGFVVSPSLINIGQNAYVINTFDGQDGLRSLNLRYLNLPLAFKVHIINLAFLKISGIAAVSPAFLIDGSETITHNETKLTFPTEVYPILPPGYTVEYDGVVVPAVEGLVISEKKDFRPMQVFAAMGVQSDWDITNNWRVIFDLRFNYGLMDPRSDDYLNRLNTYQTLYDMPGKRTDMFVQLSVGIARYLEFEKSDQERKKKLKGTTRQYVPTNSPYRKPRSSQPRG